MKAETGIKFSFIMLVVYLALAGLMMFQHDREHALMFLCGSLLWTIAIFVWSRTKRDEGDG